MDNFNIGLGVKVVDDASKIQSEINKKAKNIKLNADLNLNYDKQILNNQINTYMNKNVKAAKEYESELNNIKRRLVDADNTQFRNLRKEFTSIKSEATALGKSGEGVFSKFKSDIGNFLTFVTAGGAIMSGINAVKQMVANVAELDRQLVELSKVTNLSAEGLKNVTQQAYSLGETVGKTGTDALATITSFVRAGYDLQDALDLSKQALMMVNVSENITDAGVAAEDLVHILNGLGEGANYAKTIVDAINQVSNTQAVDFDNLVDGATRLSAVAKQSGVSFQQMLGILTAGYSTLGNMEKVASGAITIFTRLQSIQMDGEEGVQTVAKLQEDFSNATNGVVNIVDKTSGQLRNAYDILNDLDGVWGTLDKNTQEALAFDAAGTRQKSVFLSIVDNWDMVKESVKSATDSMGSADQENQKYLDSIQGKTKAFASQFQKLSQDTINSEWIKTFVDAGTETLKLVDNIGTLNVALIALGAVVGIKTGFFKTFAYEIGNLMIKQTAWTTSTYAQAYAQIGLTGAIKATALATKEFLLTNPIGWIAIGVTAIYALTKAYDYINVSLEENQKKLEKQKAAYDDATSNVKSLTDELNNCKSKLDELNSVGGAKVANDNEKKKLEAQTQELQRQLDITKEKQRIEGLSAEKTATKTLGTKIDSKYGAKAIYSESSFGDNMKYKQVTRDVELKDTIDDYNKLAKSYKSLETEQQKLANSGKGNTREFKNNTKELTSLADKMDESRKYANDLATKMQTESDSLIGATESGNKMKKVIDGSLSSYTQWVNGLNNTNTSLDAVSKSTNVASESTQQLASQVDGASIDLDKTIDTFQTNIKTIGDALTDISSLSTSDILDLMQQFSDFDWSKYGVTGVAGVGNLKDALTDLAKQQYESTIATTGNNQALQDLYNNCINASSSAYSLADALTALAETKTDITNLKKEIKEYGVISVDTVNELLKKYPQLTSVLNDYESGLSSSSDVVKSLGTIYQEDLYNWESALLIKNKDNVQFTNLVGGNYATLVNEIMKMTGVDISNDKNYYAQKMNILNSYLSQATTNWQKYYNQVTGKLVNLDDPSLSDGTRYYLSKQYTEAQKATSKLSSYYKGLNFKGVSANYSKINPKSSNTKSKSSSEDKNLNTYNDKKTDLDHKLAMDLISEDKYYKDLRSLENKYLKDKKKYKDERNSVDEAIYKYQKQKSEDAIKAQFDSLDHAYAMGTKTEAQYQKARMDLANKYYKNNKDKLSEYRQIQEDYYKWQQEQAKAVIQKQKDDFADQIQHQKDLNSLKEDEYKYQKSIAEKTADISKAEARRVELEQAAKTGDRGAQAEIDKIDEDLANKKQDLADTQHDHEVDLQNQALDLALDYNNQLLDAKMNLNKADFDAKKKYLDALFKQELDYIKQANAYAKALSSGKTVAQPTVSSSSTKQFVGGGIVEVSTPSSFARSMGEDGVALVKNKEGILKPDEVTSYRQVGAYMPLVAKILTSYSPTGLNSSSFTANNNSPSMHFDSLINIEGNATPEIVNKLEQNVPRFADQLFEQFMTKVGHR